MTFSSPCKNEMVYATTLPESCKISWSLLLWLLLLLIQSRCKNSARECCLCIPFWDNTYFSSGRNKRGIKFLQSSWTVCRPGKRKKRFLPFLNEPHLRPLFLVGNYNSNSVICHFDKDLHSFLVQRNAEAYEDLHRPVPHLFQWFQNPPFPCCRCVAPQSERWKSNSSQEESQLSTYASCNHNWVFLCTLQHLLSTPISTSYHSLFKRGFWTASFSKVRQGLRFCFQQHKITREVMTNNIQNQQFWVSLD